MPSIKQQQELDKYYTNIDIAEKCHIYFTKILGVDKKEIFFVEPSAGSGSFLNFLDNYIAFDILPQHENIHQLDFLSSDIKTYLKDIKKKIVFIGNPPFGKKSKLAIEFLNKCLTYSDHVGFIVPIQFKKWSVQSKIDKQAKLIFSEDLPSNSFSLAGKPYDIRCCFQVWSKDSEQRNLRIINKPPTEHQDFQMWQYNRTQLAEKYFDYDWDFAVPRQGYLDYSIKAFKKEDCNKKHQWIFFKARNKDILSRLLTIDFSQLSQNNTGTPGFGKHDVVSYYQENLEKSIKY